MVTVLRTYLVTKNLDLAVGSMDGFIAAVVVAVSIDLNHQRKPFYSFLWGEVCAQAIHCDENLCARKMTFLNVVQTTIKLPEIHNKKWENKIKRF